MALEATLRGGTAKAKKADMPKKPAGNSKPENSVQKDAKEPAKKPKANKDKPAAEPAKRAAPKRKSKDAGIPQTDSKVSPAKKPVEQVITDAMENNLRELTTDKGSITVTTLSNKTEPVETSKVYPCS